MTKKWIQLNIHKANHILGYEEGEHSPTITLTRCHESSESDESNIN